MSAIVANRARVHLKFPWWLRPFVMKSVVGITVGRRVYLAVARAREEVEGLLWHELTHVAQVNRLGFIRFYWLYVTEYVRHRRAGLGSSEAYRSISFEREAFAAEQAHGRLDV